MCRFLMVSSENNINPQKILDEFADACKKSIAPNGDRQIDGFGIAWLDQNEKWQILKSLKPIWEDVDQFSAIPKIKVFAAHARGATFAKEKGDITFNQPYFYDKYCFVFNGTIKGVKLKKKVPGKIGAQKIWSLLKERLRHYSVSDSLNYIKELLEENSEEITALNIGIASKDSLNALCKYSSSKNYYTLNYSSNYLKIICSEKLRGISFNEIQNEEIITV